MIVNFKLGSVVKFFFFLVIFFAATPIPANAFSVSPLKYVLTLDPGSAKNLEVTVENDETTQRNFRILVDSLAVGQDGKVSINRDSSPAENWFTVVPNSFRLNPGQKRVVEMKIAVPANEPPGSRSLALLVRSEREKNQTVGLSGQSAIPVLLTVAGEVNEKLEILEWRADKKFFTDEKVVFSLLLENDGNVNVNGAGELRVKDVFGRQKYSEGVSLGSEIFTGSKRKLSVRSTSSLWPGVYRAELVIQYGALGTYLKAVSYFLFLPVWFIVVKIILAATLIYLIVMKLRRRKYVGPQV